MNTPQEPKPMIIYIQNSDLDFDLDWKKVVAAQFPHKDSEIEATEFIEHSAYQKSQDELKLAKELIKKASETLELADAHVKHRSDILFMNQTIALRQLIEHVSAELRAFQGKV